MFLVDFGTSNIATTTDYYCVETRVITYAGLTSIQCRKQYVVLYSEIFDSEVAKMLTNVQSSKSSR
jgi:hypothetical protein